MLTDGLGSTPNHNLSWGNQPVKKSGNITAAKVVVLAAALALLSIWSLGAVGAQNAQEVQSSGLQPGDYVIYAESNASLQYMAGYYYWPNPFSPSPVTVYYPDNRSSDFYSLRIEWKILSVSSEQYLVNYTVYLQNTSESNSSWTQISTELTVSRFNNTLYSLRGTNLGTWPYFLSPEADSPGSRIVLYHNYFEYDITPPSRTSVKKYWNATEFVSLPQGGGIPNSTANNTFFDSELEVPAVGVFRTDRLFVTYPYWNSLTVTQNGSGLTGAPYGSDGSTSQTLTLLVPSGGWVGIYDRFSGIMLAYDNYGGQLVDDILLHALGIWYITFDSPSLMIVSTDIPLQPDSTGQFTPCTTSFLSETCPASSSQSILPGKLPLAIPAVAIAGVALAAIAIWRTKAGRSRASV